MKRNLFFIMFMLVATSMFAQVPASLFMRGSALAESSAPIVMKRIYKDFPASHPDNPRKLGTEAWPESNTYELFTALKTGSFEFATTAEGGALIASQTITVSGSGLIPYRIRVNFDGPTPDVSVLEVLEVVMWAPNSGSVVANFDYKGKSIFQAEGIEYVSGAWGEPRYRLRVYTEDGDYITYSYKGSDNGTSATNDLTPQNDDLTPEGWYDLYPTINQDGPKAWSQKVGETTYNGTQFKLSKKRRAEGFPLEPFDMQIVFSTTGNYTHIIRDQGGLPPIPSANKVIKMTDFSVYPTSIENSVTIATKEDNFSVEFISVTGISVLKANSAGNTLTLDNINLPKGIYLVKITSADNAVAVKHVIKL